MAEGHDEQAWTDRHGDVWTLDPDGLMHTPETRPFPREHVEKKWGPLRLLSPTTTECGEDDDDWDDEGDECQHEWELRSEHDTWVCDWCQAETTAPGALPGSPGGGA